MAGDGAAKDELEEMARELDIRDRVTFLGWRSDVLDWIALADCVVQPSLSESFCQVVVESMILETPIIVTPVGIAPDAIISGERGGILVPIGSDEKIAEAIIDLAANKDLRRSLGRKGHEFVVSEYSLRATASKHEAIYRSLC
jgi:glycosyltransferase involved in cell wall biosynthesis